jgi:hypothetical protein
MDSPSSVDATSFLSENNADQLNDGLSVLQRFVNTNSSLKDQAAAVIKIIENLNLKAGQIRINISSSNTVM